MQRISVVGTSGSGKTTFARRLSERLAVPHVELDWLFWGPAWTPVESEEFRHRVTDAAAGEAWVCDGNYSIVRQIVFDRADTVVWLDLSLRTCLWRVVRRTMRRARSGEELWGTGNRESWRRHLGRESLLWWVLSTHGRRRREYEARFADPALAHIRVHRFATTTAADAWLASLEAPTGAQALT